MENETQHPPKTSRNNTFPIIIGVVVILIIGAGGFYYYHKINKSPQAVMGTSAQPHPTMGPSGMAMHRGGKGDGKMHMAMQPMPSPTLSVMQTQELATGSSTTTTVKTFHINGGNFYFTPNNITVNKGDKVTFILTNDGGFHNIMIDEFNVKSDNIMTGKSTSVTFTADKTGSFVYYCGVTGHRQEGMWGTLTVK